MQEISRRRLLGMAGAGAAGIVGAHLVGGVVPAGAAPGAGTSDPRSSGQRLTDRYAMKYPIVQAGISALYVTPELAAAVSNAGGLGCLGAAPEPAAGVRNLIRKTKALTSRPFGMDFVYFPLGGVTVWGPDYEHDREHRTREINWSCTDAHIDACIDEQIAYVVFFWTPPEARWVKRLKAAGIDVWAQVGVAAGGAGGNRLGRRRPDRPGDAGRWPQPRLHGRRAEPPPGTGPSGESHGPSRGQRARCWWRRRRAHVAAALREGAEAAWVGTIFAASKESYAHEEYKRRVVAVQNGWVETRGEHPLRPGMAGRIHTSDRQPGGARMAGPRRPAHHTAAPRPDRTAPLRRLHRSRRRALRDAEIQPHAPDPRHHRRLRRDGAPGRGRELPARHQGAEGGRDRGRDG